LEDLLEHRNADGSDAAQRVYADLDVAAIAAVRRSGQVFNYRDWEGQPRAAPRR
jgi:hypothetical protein